MDVEHEDFSIETVQDDNENHIDKDDSNKYDFEDDDDSYEECYFDGNDSEDF